MIDNKKIYQSLKDYINAKSEYNPFVLRTAVDNKYPLVVFEDKSDLVDMQTQDRYRLNETRNANYEISIFAINVGETSSDEICNELSQLVIDVMQRYYGMQGGIDAKLKNINTSKAMKVVLHFNCIYDARRNFIY